MLDASVRCQASRGNSFSLDTWAPRRHIWSVIWPERLRALGRRNSRHEGASQRPVRRAWLFTVPSSASLRDGANDTSDVCDVCEPPTLIEIKYKVICRSCGMIIRSCADLAAR